MTRDLPEIIPIFPLQGALLLPGAELPLNIFEPRYLNMVRDALAGERLIGMIQPRLAERRQPDDRPEVFATGCAGSIAACDETADGRLRISLAGLIRFDVVREVPAVNGYRRVAADYGRYAADLDGSDDGAGERPALLAALSRYLDGRGIAADWGAVEELPDRRLVDLLAMACPFAPEEKQALLEAADGGERSRVMIALMEMGAAAGAQAVNQLH